MDINPLSLLEVTMTPDPVEEDDDDDDDCVIIDPPIETHVIDDVPDPEIPEQEQEMLSTAGLHFMEQTDERLEDPLSLNAKRIPSLWVTSSINSLNNVTTLELEFRKSHYPDVQSVLNDKLHCTICQEHVGCDIRAHPTSIEHPILKVLVCEKCCITYKKYHFVLNDNGKETRCRWCGKSPMGGGAPLKRCDNCPFSFCQSCLQKNFPPAVNKVYACCICDMKMLWPARSLLWALQTLMNHLLSRPTSSRQADSLQDRAVCAEYCRQIKMKKMHEKRKRFQTPKLRKILPKGPTNVNVANSLDMTQEDCRVVEEFCRMNGLSGIQKTPQQGKPGTALHSQTKSQNNNPTKLKVRAEKIRTSWLISRIEGYENDLLNIVNKLKNVRKQISEEETIQTINTKVETITTFLSLNSNLLKDSSLNLMNLWKEKKSRHAIENMNLNISTQNNSKRPVATSSSINSIIPHNTNSIQNLIRSKLNGIKQNNAHKTYSRQNVISKKFNGTRQSNIKRTPSKNRKRAGGFATSMKPNLTKLNAQFQIKPCSVKLIRLQLNEISQFNIANCQV